MARLLPPPDNHFGHSAVQDGIITLKTSAAFLSSLGDNLRLNSASPLPSPSPVVRPLPDVEKSPHTQTLQDLKPISLSRPPAKAHKQNRSCDSTSSSEYEGRGQRSRKGSIHKPAIRFDDDLEPPFNEESIHNVYLTADPSLKTQALDVLAATVRFQSLTALRAILTHPLTVTCLALFLFLIDRLVRFTTRTEWNGKYISAIGPIRLSLAILTTWSICVLIASAVAYLALRLPYREASLSIDTTWLAHDEVIVAVPSSHDTADADPTVLGTLVLSYRLRELPGHGKCRKPRRIGRGIVRGWSVSRKFQDQGIGEALLREAARVVAARGGDSLCFAEEHAHSSVVLSRFWNGWMERRERWARWRLEGVWEEARSWGRRR